MQNECATKMLEAPICNTGWQYPMWEELLRILNKQNLQCFHKQWKIELFLASISSLYCISSYLKKEQLKREVRGKMWNPNSHNINLRILFGSFTPPSCKLPHNSFYSLYMSWFVPDKENNLKSDICLSNNTLKSD